MAKKQSAGLVVYRRKNGQLEVLIAHMGSPWWAKKDVGAWSIPKGEYSDSDNPRGTAEREFKEELGFDPPPGEWLELGEVKQKGGKSVTAYAVEGDLDVSHIISNTFKLEWPPKSGQIREFPEIDKAGWFSVSEATEKLVPGQDEFLQRLAAKLGIDVESQQNSLF